MLRVFKSFRKIKSFTLSKYTTDQMFGFGNIFMFLKHKKHLKHFVFSFLLTKAAFVRCKMCSIVKYY